MVFYLTDSGVSGLFWDYTITVIGLLFVYLSVAEMASM